MFSAIRDLVHPMLQLCRIPNVFGAIHALMVKFRAIQEHTLMARYSEYSLGAV